MCMVHLHKQNQMENNKAKSIVVTIEAKNIVAETVVAPFPLVAT